MNRPKHVRLRKKVMKLDFQLRKLKLERELLREDNKRLSADLEIAKRALEIKDEA